MCDVFLVFGFWSTCLLTFHNRVDFPESLPRLQVNTWWGQSQSLGWYEQLSTLCWLWHAVTCIHLINEVHCLNQLFYTIEPAPLGAIWQALIWFAFVVSTVFHSDSDSPRLSLSSTICNNWQGFIRLAWSPYCLKERTAPLATVCGLRLAQRSLITIQPYPKLVGF